MYYEPPKKWTEELLKELSAEDDRYEWKSGAQISRSNLNEFWNTLAKEVGAFANSFGGTLFVGVNDDKTKVGVPAIVSGRTSIERWLENKIPTLFELRLQHFRVSRVQLSESTQKQIGDNNVIIAVDVFDSELAPHQCIFDHKYYYRVNSESRPAPHHYLAFLWGRQNVNMSRVASWWLRDFLTPLIELLQGVSVVFKAKLFNLTGLRTPHTLVNCYYIDFTHDIKWFDLIGSTVGEYFLSTFPITKQVLESFQSKSFQFRAAVNELKNFLNESSSFLEAVRSFYERVLTSRQIVAPSNLADLNLEELTARIRGELHLQTSSHSREAKLNFVNLVIYRLLGLEVLFPQDALQEDWQLADSVKEFVKELDQNDSALTALVKNAHDLYDIIQEESSSLLQVLKKDRLDLGKQYTATEW